jgi:hypothetical protein
MKEYIDLNLGFLLRPLLSSLHLLTLSLHACAHALSRPLTLTITERRDGFLRSDCRSTNYTGGLISNNSLSVVTCRHIHENY